MKKIFCMGTLMKKLMVVAALAVTAYTMQAFSLMGPWATWQTSTLSYQLTTVIVDGEPFVYRDSGGPMGLREGYRVNIPVLTYAFDKTFMETYGEEGVAEVERAFETINKTFKEMYSSDSYLDTVPTQVTRYNYRAMALGLIDIYSYTLAGLVERLGLASPERFCWTLRDTITSGNVTDPNGNVVPDSYYTIRRNFDPVTLETTPYVNGTLYSYRIIPGVIVDDSGTWIHDAVEVVPDPSAIAYSSVAGGVVGGLNQGFAVNGFYYTGLSRDDVGGLRWLYSPSNYAFESMPSSGTSSAAIMTPQYNDPIIVTNIDLAQFLIDVEQTTNTQAQVEALYPGLNITGRTWTNVLVNRTNYIYTNSPWMPVGMAPVLTPVVTKNIQLLYSYTYDNVYTNYGGTVTEDVIRLVTVSSGNQSGNPWMPVGATGTVTNTTEIKTNRVTGGIMIMANVASAGVGETNQPTLDVTNDLAGYKFIYTNPYPLRVAVTNLIASTGDVPTASTNVTEDTGTGTGGTVDDGTGTNVVTYFAQYMASSHDVYEYLAYPITWSSTASAEGDTNAGVVLYRPGLGSNLRFQRVNFDGLVGNTYTPTNMFFSNIFYMDMSSTTNPYAQLDTTVIRRQINSPDMVFSAGDLMQNGNYFIGRYSTNTWLNLSAENRVNVSDEGEVTGPGVIVPTQSSWVFTSLLDVWVNMYGGPPALFEQEDGKFNTWASFDGTTNDPVIYPISSTRTLKWLEEQLTNSRPASVNP
ncbi:MAG: hypothetical protein M0Q48_10180 [Verrucomicrobia bacterium]|nr:hypothetical protein [Verrucomicrobiota bacterium]